MCAAAGVELVEDAAARARQRPRRPLGRHVRSGRELLLLSHQGHRRRRGRDDRHRRRRHRRGSPRLPRSGQGLVPRQLPHAHGRELAHERAARGDRPVAAAPARRVHRAAPGAGRALRRRARFARPRPARDPGRRRAATSTSTSRSCPRASTARCSSSTCAPSSTSDCRARSTTRRCTTSRSSRSSTTAPCPAPSGCARVTCASRCTRRCPKPTSTTSSSPWQRRSSATTLREVSSDRIAAG